MPIGVTNETTGLVVPVGTYTDGQGEEHQKNVNGADPTMHASDTLTWLNNVGIDTIRSLAVTLPDPPPAKVKVLVNNLSGAIAVYVRVYTIDTVDGVSDDFLIAAFGVPAGDSLGETVEGMGLAGRVDVTNDAATGAGGTFNVRVGVKGAS